MFDPKFSSCFVDGWKRFDPLIAAVKSVKLSRTHIGGTRSLENDGVC